jgi:hypothetical protein
VLKTPPHGRSWRCLSDSILFEYYTFYDVLAEIEKSATEDTDFITSGNWNKTHIFKARNAFPNKSVDMTDSTLL